MSIILIEAAGIYHKGVKRWLHGFVEPVAIVTPINILEVVTKPPVSYTHLTLPTIA